MDHLSQQKLDKKNIFRHVAAQEKLKKKRKEFLVNELKKLGTEYRDDSRLCRKYVFGEEIPIIVIADMLREIDWYYKNTSYDDINHILQAAHKTYCPFDIDPFLVKDLFSSMAKNLCFSPQWNHCTENQCILRSTEVK